MIERVDEVHMAQLFAERPQASPHRVAHHAEGLSRQQHLIHDALLPDVDDLHPRGAMGGGVEEAAFGLEGQRADASLHPEEGHFRPRAALEEGDPFVARR